MASFCGQVDPLSIDHKPTCPEEKSRVVSAGGWVQFNRVNGNLALSRAFGDFVFKRNEKRSAIEQIVIAHPDVQTRPLDERLEFIVMACDGVWDVMTNEEVIEFCRRRLVHHMPPVAICEELITRCLAPDCQMGSGIGCDNMTVILICYLNGATYEAFCSRLADATNLKGNAPLDATKCDHHNDHEEKRQRRVKLNVDKIIINGGEEEEEEEDDDEDEEEDVAKPTNTLDKASDSESSECNSSASSFDDPMLQKDYEEEDATNNNEDGQQTPTQDNNKGSAHNPGGLVNGSVVVTSGENAHPEVVTIQMNKPARVGLPSPVTSNAVTTESSTGSTSHESNVLNNNNNSSN